MDVRPGIARTVYLLSLPIVPNTNLRLERPYPGILTAPGATGGVVHYWWASHTPTGPLGTGGDILTGGLIPLFVARIIDPIIRAPL